MELLHLADVLVIQSINGRWAIVKVTKLLVGCPDGLSFKPRSIFRYPQHRNLTWLVSVCEKLAVFLCSQIDCLLQNKIFMVHVHMYL